MRRARRPAIDIAKLTTGAFRGLLVAMLGIAPAAGRASGTVAQHATGFTAPSLVTSSLTLPAQDRPAPCDDPDCVRRKLDARSTVRLSGEFGSFTGKIARWAPDSLAGFDSDPDQSGPALAGALSWTQVQSVEEQVSGKRRGAILGALGGGLIGAVVGAWLTAPGMDLASSSVVPLGPYELSSTATVVTTTTVGILVGAGLGAAIGSTVRGWSSVYRRP